MNYIKLNELCDINIGKTPSRSNEDFWGTGIKWLSIADLKNKIITETKEEITEHAVKKCNMRIVPKDTVVMSFKLSIGKVGILKEAMCTNEAIANFPIKDNKRLLPEYLYYALKTLNFDSTTDRAVMGATLNKAKLNEIKIPFTNISAQGEIVKVLNKAQELIDKRKAQIDALDELVKSRFIEMFGNIETNPNDFPIVTLGTICTKITDGKHGGCEVENGSGYYYVGAREIYGGVIHYDTAPEITYKDFEKDYKRCNIENGDFVIVNTGATIGKTAIAKSSLTDRTLLQKSVALIKAKKEVVLPIFIQYCYITNPKLHMVESASAQPNLLLSKIKKTEIYLPPLGMQKEFVDFVNQVDKLKFAMQESLTQLEDNFNSLMQKAFKGELFI